MANDVVAGWLMEYADGSLNLWSGLGDLDIGNKTYKGTGNLVGISAASEGIDIPDDRLSVTLNVAGIDEALDANNMSSMKDTLRELLLKDEKLHTIKVSWLFSSDKGRTWYKSNLQFVGFLSKPTFDGSLYTIELEQYKGSGENIIVWSDEFQKSLYPDDDGFEYMRVFGQPFRVNWPHSFDT